MMPKHDCDHFTDRLAAALLDGAPANDLLAEGRRCPACAAVMRDLAHALAPASIPEPSRQVAERAIRDGSRWARRAFVMLKLINLSISVVFVTCWLLFVELGTYGAVGFQLSASTRSVTVVTTVVALGYVALRGRLRDGRRERLYARWPGRQLQGVCVGIAEFFGVPLALVRLAFVALFFGGLGGGTIYFLLSFLVSFHPDDRRYMRWFRIQRWWRRRRGLPDPA